MSLRFHEIAEANHRIQSPMSDRTLMHLGEICDLNTGSRLLDLACGKGELLCRWAETYGIQGVGVDMSQTFVDAAHERAQELKVWAQVQFIVDDAATYPQPFHQYDIVSCIGATWIGGGLVGTIELMKQSLKDQAEGLLLVGDTFWEEDPPDSVCEALGIERDYLTDLGGLSDRFDEVGVELVEMLITSDQDWDRYYAKQWMTVSQWLKNNPNAPDAGALRLWINENRRTYLQVERRYLGWGVFVLRVIGDAV